MPQALQIIFIRHGETDDNITRTLQGHRDTSLTELGQSQAATLTTKLLSQYPASAITAIYHSPLLRIRQTIAPLLAELDGRGVDAAEQYVDLQGRGEVKGVKVVSDADWKGQALGKLEGGSYDSIDMGNPRSADGGEGVEAFDVFVERVRGAFGRCLAAELKRLKGDEAGGKKVLVVATHGVGITSLFKVLEGSLQPEEGKEGYEWRRVARRGDGAYEVRWTDSDDIASLVLEQPEELAVGEEAVQWGKVKGEPFLIEYWGKKEKADVKQTRQLG